jgi:predicted nucleic acid-binding protein
VSGFLIDTNIISLLAPGRPAVNEHVSGWIAREGNAGNLYLSVITLAELERGLQKLNRNGSTQRAGLIETWIKTIQDQFSDHILSIDAAIARIAGRFDALAQSQGHQPGLADMMIAATASSHNLVLVTANTKHFQFLPIEVINPAKG